MVLLVSYLFTDLSMFRSSPVFGIQRYLKMLVIYVRTDCSVVRASLCICQDSGRVHSWGHFQTWASSTCLSPHQYHPSWSENLSHQLWDCSTHFTGVRHSFYFDPLELGWQQHVLGSEACETALIEWLAWEPSALWLFQCRVYECPLCAIAVSKLYSLQ